MFQTILRARFGLWLLILLLGLTLKIGLAQELSPNPQPDPLDTELGAAWTQQILPVIKQHCGECHMDGANEAGVNLGDYSTLEKIRSHESTWEQIRGVIRADAMPPPESSKMTPQERAIVTRWIERTLHEVDCNHRPPTPHVTVRRLNQFEYDNTIRDIFGVDFRPSKEIGFVSDDVGNGFDNQGEVLTLAPIALEKYLQAAALISKRVISLDRESFRKQSFEGEYLPFGQSLKVPLHLAPGKYNASIRTRFGDDQKDNCKAKLWLDEQLIAEWEVTPKDETAKYDFETTAGDHSLRIEYTDDSNPEARGAPNRRLIVHSVRIVGPEQGEPAFPKIHQQVVIATAEDKDQPDAMPIGFTEATRRVFLKLLPKLYRRSVSQEEVHAVMMVCQKASDAGCSYEESLRYGLQGALVAPQFLFRYENLVESDNIRRLDDYGIATRLAYFLWASTPDDVLLSLAAENRLHEPEVLNAQVERMLADPRSDSLISGFFSQWLGLRNIQKIDIDRDKFPMWSDRLRAAMIKETETFCKHVLSEGSIEDFLTADFTFVNPRLAEFYGVEFDGKQPSELYKRRPGRNDGDPRRQGLYEQEDRWIRVSLPENRKGVLTQAAALALTSNPTRSSAVKRGKWILETVLGDPPPSAPPNVPSLEQAKADDKASLRERLEIHRSNPSCAGCHKLIDPIGLGLENFDATGRWRDVEDGKEILAQGALVDGKTFTGPTELIQILSERTPDVAKNFTQRLLTYALGRGLQRADRCDVDKILNHARENRYTIKSVIHGIVQSDSFLQRSPALPTTQANRN
jgi:mono/diheme cytochrome c family protein